MAEPGATERGAARPGDAALPAALVQLVIDLTAEIPSVDEVAGVLHELASAVGVDRVALVRVDRADAIATTVGDEALATEAARHLLGDERVRAGVELVVLPERRFHRSALAFVPAGPGRRTAMTLAGAAVVGVLERLDAAAFALDAHAELEHRLGRLERANEELERFAFTAAHDLAAPLSRIEMTLGAASAAADADPERIAIARRAAERMRELIDALLGYATVGRSAVGVTDVDLGTVLGEVQADLEADRRRAGGRIEVGELPRARGDRALLRQLFQNLLQNALRFHRPGVAPVVSVTATETADHVVVTVADNGLGIPPDRRGEVFSPLVRLQADAAGEGAGLGLATALAIVRRHRGSIRAEDGPEGGTAMVVELPKPVANGG